MKRFSLILMAVFAMATIGCHTVDRANEKIEECLDDEYGDDLTSEIEEEWELSCEDGDENCDKCVDCVMDSECGVLLEGECAEECKLSILGSPLIVDPLIVDPMPHTWIKL